MPNMNKRPGDSRRGARSAVKKLAKITLEAPRKFGSVLRQVVPEGYGAAFEISRKWGLNTVG